MSEPVSPYNSPDPATGLVAQSYRPVDALEYIRYVAGYAVELVHRRDDDLGVNGWNDPTQAWPEGLVAFQSQRTGQRYVREAPERRRDGLS